jgi:hypothetical protein
MPSKKNRITVYLDETEHQQILKNADKARLSLSTFCKRVCLGYTIKSIVDQRAILELVRMGGNFGRLGGLLKNALGEGTLERSTKVNHLIDELIIDKENIMEFINEIKNDKKKMN